MQNGVDVADIARAVWPRLGTVERNGVLRREVVGVILSASARKEEAELAERRSGPSDLAQMLGIDMEPAHAGPALQELY